MGVVQLRTNIILDDQLITEAQKLTSLPTKKAVVDEALRTLIRLKKQETILSLQGKIHWRGDLDSSRTGRPRAGNR
jgi:Arc/MetJ family transcription regulator